MNFSQIARPLCLTSLLLASSAAFAGPSPQGQWRVADGTATIRVHRCGAAFCGNIATTITPAGKDIHNPDPRKRNRTVLGIEVLYALRATGPNAWSGYSYNAQDGQTYTITVSLASATSLRVQGCVPGGGACGGETWTRTR